MKKFTLICDAGHSFAGWFRSDDALQSALSADDLACPDCGTSAVAKGLQRPNMPPALGRGRGAMTVDAPVSKPSTPAVPASPPGLEAPQAPALTPPSPSSNSTSVARSQTMAPPSVEVLEQMAKLYTAIKAVETHVKSKFEDVGTQFADEARKIHYGEEPERGIYGKASKDDVEELEDEGITVLALPQLPEAN